MLAPRSSMRGCFFCLCLAIAAGLASDAALAQEAPGESQSQLSLQAGGEWQSSLQAVQTAGEWATALESLVRMRLRLGGHPWRLYADLAARAEKSLDGAADRELSCELERLYLKLFLPDVDVAVGRQDVRWGVGYAWSPTDVFGRARATEPGEPRPGVNALVARVPAGPLGYWSVVAAENGNDPGSGSAEEGLRYGLCRHGNLRGVDWSLVAAVDAGATMVGADAKGDLGLGWHGEVACFAPRGGSASWLEAVLGADHSWEGGRFVWLGEYFYNSRGAGARESYDYVAWLSGEEGYLARHYAFGSLTYRHTEFVTLSGSAMVNLVDGSAALGMGCGLLLGGEWRLHVSATVPTGDDGDEFAGGPIPGVYVARPGAFLKAQMAWSF